VMGNAADICCPCRGFRVNVHAGLVDSDLHVYSEPPRCFNNGIMCAFPPSIPFYCYFSTIDKYIFKSDGTVQIEQTSGCSIKPSAQFGVTHATTSEHGDIYLHASDDTVVAKIDCGDAAHRRKLEVTDKINRFYNELRNLLKRESAASAQGEPREPGSLEVKVGLPNSSSMQDFPKEGGYSPAHSPGGSHRFVRLEARYAELMGVVRGQQLDLESLKQRVSQLEGRHGHVVEEKQALVQHAMMVPGEVVRLPLLASLNPAEEGKRGGGGGASPEKGAAASNSSSAVVVVGAH